MDPLRRLDQATDLLSEWRWIVPDGYVPLCATAFGDLFLHSPDGAVHFLDTLGATMVFAATSERDLAIALGDTTLRDDVLMPALAKTLSALLGPIAQDECFSIAIPLTLGGAMEPHNFHRLRLADHLSALGKLQAQVAHDRPGTTYTQVIQGG